MRATLLDRVHFTVTDLYRRMDFALSCAFHHGTAMIRAHINSSSDLNVTEMAWKVFNDMKVKWHDKIFLQGVIFILPSFEFGTTGKAEEIAAVGIKYGGSILGASFSTPTSEFSSDSEKDGTYTTAQFTDELSGLFALAKKFELYIDVHVDEHADGKSENLLMLARETIAQNYQGKVTASHCCSLSLASPELLQSTIQSILEAGIAVVSLPTCNLYLQVVFYSIIYSDLRKLSRTARPQRRLVGEDALLCKSCGRRVFQFRLLPITSEMLSSLTAIWI